MERFIDNCPLPKKQHLLESERAIEPIAQRYLYEGRRVFIIIFAGLLAVFLLYKLSIYKCIQDMCKVKAIHYIRVAFLSHTIDQSAQLDYEMEKSANYIFFNHVYCQDSEFVSLMQKRKFY